MSLFRRLQTEFRHAFSLETHEAEPTPEQRAMVAQLVAEIVKRRLTEPAIVLLEMSSPLNYLSAQALHFLTPIASAIFSGATLQQFAEFLERRDSLQLLQAALERHRTSADSDNGRAGETVRPPEEL